MYGIIKYKKRYFVIPMECISLADKLIATGIRDKMTGYKIVRSIINKNIQRKLDKQ